jgi:hypothetical protein
MKRLAATFLRSPRLAARKGGSQMTHSLEDAVDRPREWKRGQWSM